MASQKENKKLMKSLSKYKTTSKSLSGGLGPIKKSVGDLRSSQEALRSATKAALTELGQDMTNTFGAGLMRRLKVICG